MPFVPPKGRTRPDLPPIHAASAVYALTEVQRHRGGLAAAGVLWGRVVRVGGVVAVGSARASARVLEVGVLVGGPSGPSAFRNVKAWNEAADAFAPVLQQDFYGLLVGEWRAGVGRDGQLRHWLDLWGVYGPSDDPKRLGRPLGVSQDVLAVAASHEG
jgi:hypothetical protein